MKLAVAQYQSTKGDVQLNIDKHLDFIRLALEKKVALIVFPELSLTGYEPQLANELALGLNDARLDAIQEICDQHEIIICLGAPLKQQNGVQIAMLIFQANRPRSAYAKQLLHADELPYFIPGNTDISIQLGGLKIIPAICYEAMQAAHLVKAIEQNAALYLVSVAKDKAGMEKLDTWFTEIAANEEIVIIVANSVGACEEFVASGMSGMWKRGKKVGMQLDVETEGVLVFDV